jgi:hypothetical protein
MLLLLVAGFLIMTPYSGDFKSKKSFDSTLALHQTDRMMMQAVKLPQTEPVRIVEHGLVSRQRANED